MMEISYAGGVRSFVCLLCCVESSSVLPPLPCAAVRRDGFPATPHTKKKRRHTEGEGEGEGEGDVSE